MDMGAQRADADILWFLHADVVPPDNALNTICTAVREGAVGGCFRFVFQGRPQWQKIVLTRLIAWRIAAGGMPYGDQGIFVSRSAYRQCGGFPHQPLFEEVRLVRRLRRLGRFRLLRDRIAVSTRRWEHDGWWRRSWHNRLLALRYALGGRAETLAASYQKRKPPPGEHKP